MTALPIAPTGDLQTSRGPARWFGWLAVVLALAVGAAVPSASAQNPNDLFVFDEPRALPEINFTDAEGQGLTLADFRERVVLLNIWATWCVPCRREMPSLDRLEGILGGKGFVVVPLSIDRGGLPVVKRFYEELQLEKLGIYLDPSAKGSRALAIVGLPATLLIDRNGREAFRKMGGAEWDDPKIVELIRPYIETPGKPEPSARR
jgi:thiol-disulfide isomerase/thioredoxin